MQLLGTDSWYWVQDFQQNTLFGWPGGQRKENGMYSISLPVHCLQRKLCIRPDPAFVHHQSLSVAI